ncbi:hypothetical protein I6J18_08600 [Peribacillus psychrosaccharolyticus]|uniref:ParB/Sulfiredoxin domain-containing protein n=1 Tax=Peribacillus psychrosaccharolyticus TaxID=1407 RepID=A0A974S1P7_PERPY|nr:hypothetical protein [Peribacillus psychrosaccharolyticus]MEC2057789.1 hypothetical protein [Peribacillus psychrosaccharolyticus]MED3746315.1 hypothetical protein [Peribacillus psychrosaccharolyticus]QQT01887.1 hypothetical protein I6J18_08600 [Peribacillus psychrosaccharolyticus]
MKPVGTEGFISLEEIIVSEEFLYSHPSVDKTKEVMDYVVRTGNLDEPITINRDTNVLTNGYRRYLAAKMVGMNIVPINYEQ